MQIGSLYEVKIVPQRCGKSISFGRTDLELFTASGLHVRNDGLTVDAATSTALLAEGGHLVLDNGLAVDAKFGEELGEVQLGEKEAPPEAKRVSQPALAGRRRGEGGGGFSGDVKNSRPSSLHMGGGEGYAHMLLRVR